MPPKPKVPGLIKGLGVTFGEMVKTLKDGPQTTRYPHEREEVAPRARGVGAGLDLDPERTARGDEHARALGDARLTVVRERCRVCGVASRRWLAGASPAATRHVAGPRARRG